MKCKHKYKYLDFFSILAHSCVAISIMRLIITTRCQQDYTDKHIQLLLHYNQKRLHWCALLDNAHHEAPRGTNVEIYKDMTQYAANSKPYVGRRSFKLSQLYLESFPSSVL